MNRRVFTVEELNRYVGGLIDSEIILNNILVKGEVSNYKKHYSGNSYFTLKDKKGEINVVIFKTYMENIFFDLDNGQELIILGTVRLYEKKGQYQIIGEGAEPIGIGSRQLSFEQVKEKLEKKGFFNTEHKKVIPVNIRKVGIITSETGDVVHDIINMIMKRDSTIEILVMHTRVQGETAKEEIANHIYKMNEFTDIDVIIIGRGGGSTEDLWAFNEEIVVESIFNSTIPIISSVGHETDFTLADFVADARASTPTEAGEMVSHPIQLKIDEMEKSIEKLNKLMVERYLTSKEELKIIEGNLKQKEICDFKEHNELFKKIERKMEKLFLEKKEIKEKIEKDLNNNNPLNIIKKGYAIPKKNNKNIYSINNLDKNDKISLQVKDGIIDCIVENITSNI